MQFSPLILERFQNARFEGFPSKPAVLGMAGTHQSGRFVILGLSFQEGAILEARFRCFNCVFAIAVADWVCEQLRGMSREAASSISAEDIDDALGGLPPAKRFCAHLVKGALSIALEQAHSKGYLV